MNNSKLRLIFVDGAADALTVELRPPLDREWRVIDAFAFHNDATSRPVYWNFTSFGLGNILRSSVTLASGIRLYIGEGLSQSGNTLAGALILRHNMYAVFGLGASTAGTILKIRALVEEYDGPND